MNLATRLIVNLALALGVASLADAQEYEIRLHRPAKVGLRYHSIVVVREESDMTMSANERLLKDKHEAFSVEYEATVEVLEVHPNGRPSREKHIVQKLLFTESGRNSLVLTNGAVVVSSITNKLPRFEIEGHVAEGQVRRALIKVASPARAGTTDDDLFGTRLPKKVGESWKIEIDDELLTQELLSTNFALKDFHGTAKLKGVIRSAGLEVLLVTAKLQCKPSIPLPPGLSVKRADCVMEMSCKVPADSALPPSEASEEANVELLAVGRPQMDAREIEMRATMKESKIVKTTVLK